MTLIQNLEQERATIIVQQDELCTRAATDGRDLSDTEQANLDDLQDRAKFLDERLKQLREIADANAAAAVVRADVTTRAADDAPKAVGGAVVTREQRTYEERGENSFFQDLFHAQIMRDPMALDRISAHQREMAADGVLTRDGVVANFANLVVPQYLTDLAAPLARAGRPLADICTQMQLPADGMTIQIHRTTTGSSAAVQATENASVSETDPLDTTLTVNVVTIAGQVDLSRQLVDRGTGIEQLVMADLVAAHNTALDANLISGTGANGQHRGILVAGHGHNDRDTDDASPTPAELWSDIVKAMGDVATNRFAPANIIVMHPRRWSYLFAGLDGSSRPLVGYSASTARNPAGIGDPAGYNAVGEIAGVPVVTDANIPTDYGAGTEDPIIVARREDLLLWEEPSAPMMVRFEEGQSAANNSASLTTKLVCYSYSAFTSDRYPLGITVMQGTSLIAPS